MTRMHYNINCWPNYTKYGMGRACSVHGAKQEMETFWLQHFMGNLDVVWKMTKENF